jgi:hypothetical protein
LVGGRESGESNFGDRSRLGLGRRGAVLKDFSNAPWSSDRSGGGEQSLGKGEPEFEGIAEKGNTGVSDGGVDSRPKSKIGEADRLATIVASIGDDRLIGVAHNDCHASDRSSGIISAGCAR